MIRKTLLILICSGLATAAHAQYFNGYVSPPNGWAGSNWNGNISGYIYNYPDVGEQLRQQDEYYQARQRARQLEQQQEELKRQTQILQQMEWNQRMQQAQRIRSTPEWQAQYRRALIRYRKHHSVK